MKPIDLPNGAHGAWRMMSEQRMPADIPAAVRKLAAQGLKHHDIAMSLRIGVAAVEETLRAPQ